MLHGILCFSNFASLSRILFYASCLYHIVLWISFCASSFIYPCLYIFSHASYSKHLFYASSYIHLTLCIFLSASQTMHLGHCVCFLTPHTLHYILGLHCILCFSLFCISSYASYQMHPIICISCNMSHFMHPNLDISFHTSHIKLLLKLVADVWTDRPNDI